jgi:glycosyltransferase involved in cell wall biosynthesis
MRPVPGQKVLSIVIPAWNEAATIGDVVKETREALKLLPEGASAVLVVDNGSTDDTADRARRAGAVVVTEPGRGYGRACLKGIAALPATDVVVFMDGDGSDNPAEIPSLIDPILRGDADLVIGSRELGVFEKGAHPWHAVVGTRLCVALMNLLIGTKATDLGPFRAIRAGALAGLGMEDATFGWTTEMQIKAHRAGLRVVEVPVNYRCRRGGESKISGSLSASVRAGSRILGMIVKWAFTPSVNPGVSRKLTDSSRQARLRSPPGTASRSGTGGKEG